MRLTKRTLICLGLLRPANASLPSPRVPWGTPIRGGSDPPRPFSALRQIQGFAATTPPPPPAPTTACEYGRDNRYGPSPAPAAAGWEGAHRNERVVPGEGNPGSAGRPSTQRRPTQPLSIVEQHRRTASGKVLVAISAGGCGAGLGTVMSAVRIYSCISRLVSLHPVRANRSLPLSTSFAYPVLSPQAALVCPCGPSLRRSDIAARRKFWESLSSTWRDFASRPLEVRAACAIPGPRAAEVFPAATALPISTQCPAKPANIPAFGGGRSTLQHDDLPALRGDAGRYFGLASGVRHQHLSPPSVNSCVGSRCIWWVSRGGRILRGRPGSVQRLKDCGVRATRHGGGDRHRGALQGGSSCWVGGHKAQGH